MRKIRSDETPKKRRKLKDWDCHVTDYRGRSFNRQMQTIIHNVYSFNEKERDRAELLIPLNRPRDRTTAMCGIGKDSAVKYHNLAIEGAVLETPGKVRKRQALIRTANEQIKDRINEIIYKACDERRTLNVEKIYEALQRDVDVKFEGSKEILRKILHDIGFKFSKRDGRRYAMGEPDILIRKRAFLKSYVENYLKPSSEKLTPVFQDETWTFAHGTGKTKEWQNTDRFTCSLRKASNGARYLISNAGCEKGFIRNASLFFKTAAKPKPGDDYHGDMNAELFNNWFRDKFVPNLSEPSLIILDNAPYHSVKVNRQPANNWLKQKIKDWLDERNISYPPKANKDTLLNLCHGHKEPTRYILEDILQEIAPQHRILRTPPYHYFYNAIELIWAIAKPKYDNRVGVNNDFSQNAISKTWQDVLDEITPDIWNACVKKTEARILTDYFEEFKDNNNNVDYNLVIYDDDSDDKIAADSKMVSRSLFENLDSDDDAPQILSSQSSEDDTTEWVEVPDNEQSYICHVNQWTFDNFIPSNPTTPPLPFEIDASTILVNLLEHPESLNKTWDNEPLLNTCCCEICTAPIDEMSQEEVEAATASISKYQWIDHDCLIRTEDLVDEVNCTFEIPPEIPVKEQDSTTEKLHFNKENLGHPQKRLKVGAFELTVEQLYCLFDKNWLNDQVINVYLQIISERAGPSVYAFNSQFFSRLSSSSYEMVAKWTKKLIFEYLCQEYHTKKSGELDTKIWTKNNAKNIPRQYNNYDCGVFVCIYAERISRGACFDFAQRDMKKFRQQILTDIMSSVVSPPKLSRKRKIELPVEESFCEKDSEIIKSSENSPEIILAASANFHQATKNVFHHSNVNSQCTGIAAYALMILSVSWDYLITPELLDYILLKGDEYYLKCYNSVEKPFSKFLNVDELLPMSFNDLLVMVQVLDIAQGYFNDLNAIGVISSAIEKCLKFDVAPCGFLFIGEGKTVGFKTLETNGKKHFMLFNSHSVDINNRYCDHDSPNSRARLFICSNSSAIARLLLSDSNYSNQPWQICRLTFKSAI